MLHNAKRWAFPCPADKVGSESLKPFEGLCSGLAMQLCWETCLGLPTVKSAAEGYRYSDFIPSGVTSLKTNSRKMISTPD